MSRCRNKAYIRAQDLFKHGAISQAMVEQAEDAEKDAKADLDAAEQQLKMLGVDKEHPSSIVNVYAPISGVIIGQNVTNAAAAGVTLSARNSLHDRRSERGMDSLRRLRERHSQVAARAAGADQAGCISRRIRSPAASATSVRFSIPSLRTAKVRIEVANPGILKLGMFVTATFSSRKRRHITAVPADAVLHLHDRDWVYVPAGGNQFKRTEVHAGKMLEGGRQQILSGIDPGTQVVTNALLLEAAGNQ